MKKYYTCGSFFIFLLLMLLEVSTLAAAPIRVTVIVPDTKIGSPFWNNYATFMEVASKSLDIELTVLEIENRYEALDHAQKELRKRNKPDYLVFQYSAQQSISILKLAEWAEVKSFIVNTDITPDEKTTVGIPRQAFKQWIGHIYPDDVEAGYQLTTTLLKRGESKGLQSEDGLFHILGTGGNLIATSATYRKQGLLKAIEETPKARLDRYVLADWNRDIAREKTNILMDLYPAAKLFWAIDDNTAFGMMDAMKEHDTQPGHDGVVGGFNWSAESIDAVKNGSMEATIGGHFMEGAWVLVLLYDYHHGIDFASSGTTIKSQMRVIDSSNLDTYLPTMERSNWKKIDFKQFTKTHNPAVEEYDFSPDAIVRKLANH